MDPIVAEFLGTAILILIGGGVCANASLKQTKGNDGGWLMVNAGWGVAVFIAVLCTAEASGAHLNPAVTLGLLAAGEFGFLETGGVNGSEVLGYLIAQFAGAIFGAALVYLFYIQHFRVTHDGNAKLGTFCTAPAIRGVGPNVLGELLGTFVLVFAVLMTADATLEMGDAATVSHKIGLGALGALPVGLVVFGIGLGLGGTTGYAINPARDLGPRIAHAVLPIPNKRDSDWGYAWIPVVGPILGGLLAAIIYRVTT